MAVKSRHWVSPESDLDQAGLEVDPEPLPAQQPERGERRRARGAEARAPARAAPGTATGRPPRAACRRSGRKRSPGRGDEREEADAGDGDRAARPEVEQQSERRARPTATRAVRAASELPSQSAVGANQAPRSGPSTSATRSRYSPAGRMPCGPISPWIWQARERKADAKTSARLRRKSQRAQR